MLVNAPKKHVIEIEFKAHLLKLDGENRSHFVQHQTVKHVFTK
jgi:hypothetical protein